VLVVAVLVVSPAEREAAGPRSSVDCESHLSHIVSSVGGRTAFPPGF
jgi:hypothetical protein